MDPITTAIVAAVLAGATAGLTETSKKAIGDAYESLKGKIKEKFGADNKLSKAVTNLDEDPESKATQAVVEEKVVVLKAAEDQELVALATALTETIEAQTGQPAGVIIGGNIGGDVVTGKKTVQKAGKNAIQIGEARDVTIGRKDKN
jgi:hypothetical protein